MTSRISKCARSARNTVPNPPRSQTFNYKDGSFLSFGTEEELSRFIEKFENREILPPRFTTARYIDHHFDNDVGHVLRDGHLSDFLFLRSDYIHPILIRAFYSNLRKDEDGSLFSQVNGVDIYLNEENISSLTGLPRDGDDLPHYVGEEDALFNEQAFFEEIGIGRFIPSAEHRRPSITNMHPQYRLYFYFITRVLKPRKYNHTTLSHEDTKLLHIIAHSARINWCKLILLHMYDAVGDDRPLPYALLIMSLFQHLEIPTDVGPRKNRTKVWEIQETSFHSGEPAIAPRQCPPRPDTPSSALIIFIILCSCFFINILRDRNNGIFIAALLCAT